jgi:signal transduction histidine kinase
VFTIEKLRHQLDEIHASREALSQVQHQLLRSREEERARLARDLHDGPLQSLVGLNIQLGVLLDSKESLPSAKQLTEMRAEVKQLSLELRQVCAELRPPMLDALGLGAALRAHAEEWSGQYGIEVQVSLPSDAALRLLPGEVAVNFYRAAQEILANAGKHANAQRVEIALTWQDRQLTMIVHDNGQGFVPPDTLHGLIAQNRFGLAGMQERVELIGGQWSLKSTPGEGTTVCITWGSGDDSHIAQIDDHGSPPGTPVPDSRRKKQYKVGTSTG